MKVKVKTNHDLLLSMESISMTDIVLNMFIFFFISFSLFYTFTPEHESKIDIDLPEAQSKGGKSEEPLILNITRDGHFFLNNRKIPHDRLRGELRSVVLSRRDRALIIRADEKVDYGLVIDALDTAKLVGIERLALATVEKRQS